MRWMLFLLLLTIALVPSVNAATVYGGKLFHGQNFTTDVGGVFKIYGTNPTKITDNTTGIKEQRYNKAVITSNVDKTVYILNGTCEQTFQYKYCYLESYLDLDNPLTYQNGYAEAMFSISVETLPPPTTLIDVVRPQTIESYCGQLVTVPVAITNQGVLATNLTYSETLPVNTLVTAAIGGSVDGNSVAFKSRLQPNGTANYTFTITNFDCQNKTWNVKYSFTTYNDTIYRTITDVGIIVLPTYTIVDNISQTKVNYPSDEIIYILNITNDNPTIDLYVDFQIDGDGLTAIKSSNGISSGKTYGYKNYIPPGRRLDMSVTFTGKNFSTYHIKNTGVLKLSDRTFDYSSTNVVSIIPSAITPYIEVSSIAGDSITVDVYARNDGLSEKYYYIYGLLNGLKEAEEPVYANSVDADSTVKIASKVFNTTGISGKNNITFTGVYRDKNSVEHKIYASRVIDITSGSVVVEKAPDEIVPQTDTSTETETGVAETTSEATEITPTTPVVNTTANSTVEPKKDFISRVLEDFSKFLNALFS